jgi:hypothetical protein
VPDALAGKAASATLSFSPFSDYRRKTSLLLEIREVYKGILPAHKEIRIGYLITRVTSKIYLTNIT